MLKKSFSVFVILSSIFLSLHLCADDFGYCLKNAKDSKEEHKCVDRLYYTLELMGLEPSIKLSRVNFLLFQQGSTWCRNNSYNHSICPKISSAYLLFVLDFNIMASVCNKTDLIKHDLNMVGECQLT